MSDRTLPSHNRLQLVRLPRARRAILLAAMTALGLVAVGGCSTEPPIFDPRGMEAKERDAARGVAPDPLATYPTTLEATPTPRGVAGPGNRPSTQAYLEKI